MRRFSVRVAAGVLALVLGIAAVAFFVRQQIEPGVHRYIVRIISTSLESEVELGRTTITWFPLRVRADQLTVRHHGRTDVPPLLVLQSFIADMTPRGLWNRTVDHVSVEGMEINIPPRQGDAPRQPRFKSDSTSSTTGRLTIQQLTASNMRLSVIPGDPRKNAKVWDVFSLVIRDIQTSRPAAFEASLINPIPYGVIESKGHFGPWRAGEPSQTQLEGDYTFAADLGTIKGLGGSVDATGVMSGLLEAIETQGRTKTAAFRLTALEGGSLPLETTYSAMVDGTNGDVKLRQVDATLGRSAFQAHGTIEGTKGIKGKRVALNLTSKSFDVSELLLLVMAAHKPLALGTLVIDTAFDLPRGEGDVLDRLELNGSVRADRLLFTDDSVQDKIDNLSRKGQGRPQDTSIDEMASRLRSTFRMAKGVVSFKGLAFDVMGASLGLQGTYALRTKALDLVGDVRLTASISNTQTGFKSWVLKPFDPLFRTKGAGTLLKIKVQGSPDAPVVGLDLKKTLKAQ